MTNGYGIFARYYDALTANVRYAERAAALHRLIQRWQKPDMPDNLLLDLACGTGSLSEELARLGWDVIGADGSAEMLNEALDKKYDSGLDVQYLQQDMRKLDLFGTISVTVCMLDSINHLPCVQDVQRVMERVRLFTNPEGLFLFDVNTAYKHRNLLGEQCFVYELEDAVCVWQNQLSDTAPDYPVEIRLDFYERLQQADTYRRSTEQFTERIYPHETLCGLLQEAGFTLLELLDGDTYEAPTAESQRLLYIARATEKGENKE